MTIGFKEAIAFARAALEPSWTAGTFMIDDRNIVENDAFYVINVGAREYFVDGDFGYAIAGDVTLVNKESGEVSSAPSVEVATDPTVRVRPNPDASFGCP
ncbi:hypothetical protein ACWF9G_03920 [Nocardia sp. NPDC055029]